jgi:hypothetical protein
MEDLDKERWWLAEGTARAAVAFAETEVERAIALVNVWLSRKGRLGVDGVQAEVEAWSTDGLPPLYQLAKSTLLDQDSATLDLIGRLLSTGDLEQTSLDHWPLFASLRSRGLLAGNEKGVGNESRP